MNATYAACRPASERAQNKPSVPTNASAREETQYRHGRSSAQPYGHR